jgi:hypothetical protein
VSDDGRQYLEIAQNSPEEIYITSLFKRDYEEYAKDVKLKKYYIKDDRNPHLKLTLFTTERVVNG